jgi:hypothetical protein
MVKTLTKEQKKIFDDYAKENGLTFEQAVNYACSMLATEMEG